MWFCSSTSAAPLHAQLAALRLHLSVRVSGTLVNESHLATRQEQGREKKECYCQKNTSLIGWNEYEYQMEWEAVEYNTIQG